MDYSTQQTPVPHTSDDLTRLLSPQVREQVSNSVKGVSIASHTNQASAPAGNEHAASAVAHGCERSVHWTSNVSAGVQRESAQMEYTETIISKKSYSYSTKDLLGEGAFGKVYKGVCVDDQRVVAIKHMTLENLKKCFGENYERMWCVLDREIDILQRLEYHCFVTYYDHIRRGEDDFFIVMEYCNGGNFLAWLSVYARHLQVHQKVAIMAEIALSIYALHSNGIWHRDVKPENVLVHIEEQMQVRLDEQTQMRFIEKTQLHRFKLSDFGYAKRQPQDGAHNTANTGTLIYKSPESITKDLYGTGASNDTKQNDDLWGLGVIFYMFLSNCNHPFFDSWDEVKELHTNVKSHYKRAEQYLGKIRLGPKNRNPSGVERIDKLVMSMLSDDYKQRQTAEDVFNELNTIVNQFSEQQPNQQ